MEAGFRCPRCGFANPAVAALSEALLTMGRERSIHATLRQIVDAVRHLANASCAALGIVGEDGALEHFITAGMSDEMVQEMGQLPPTAGLFRAALQERLPIRIPDVSEDRRADGTPAALLDFGSFMGVPLVSDEGVLGALFLFGRSGAPAFTAADQEEVQILASHAILAVDNARLFERSRELTVIEERNRLARELHDAVSQTLFSIVFTAESVATLLERDPEAARGQVADLKRLAQDAQREMRSLIFELRPAEIEREGLVSTLGKQVDVLRRVYAAKIELTVAGECRLASQAEKEVFRISQEAMSNALRHSGAERVWIRLSMDGDRVSLEVQDDGKGFDPLAAGGHARLGLTSMRERVQLLGGVLAIDSAPGRGTTVSVEVPYGR
ncbi:MAG: GAF domain-containing sensor histidine kinase [Actinomycetota bacterium]